jgi:hypothetical protein
MNSCNMLLINTEPFGRCKHEQNNIKIGITETGCKKINTKLLGQIAKQTENWIQLAPNMAQLQSTVIHDTESSGST